MKREMTDNILARIDEALASLNVPTRSTWTTREIENLLLDMRNDILSWVLIDQHAADLIADTEAMLREHAKH
jgi:hypothetical protein